MILKKEKTKVGKGNLGINYTNGQLIKFDGVDLKTLDILMKKFKHKNRSEVIRKYIDMAMYQESYLDLISYMD